jgi:hypothetical protein
MLPLSLVFFLKYHFSKFTPKSYDNVSKPIPKEQVYQKLYILEQAEAETKRGIPRGVTAPCIRSE